MGTNRVGMLALAGQLRPLSCLQPRHFAQCQTTTTVEIPARLPRGRASAGRDGDLRPAVGGAETLDRRRALGRGFPLDLPSDLPQDLPDYDNQIDPAFAIYLFGILAGLSVLLPSLCVAPLLVLSLAAPLFLIGYYLLYHHVIDMNGMLLIRQTNYNEIIEFSAPALCGRLLPASSCCRASSWPLS